MTGVVAAVVVGVAVLLARGLPGLFAAPDYPGPGAGSVTVLVQPGDTATAIGRTLQQAGVVRSVAAFVAAADADPRSRLIAPGYYRLRRHMRASLALDLLLDPAAAVGRLVLPAGLPLRAALPRIAAAAGLPLAQLAAAAGRPTGVGLPAWAGGRLEGFLYGGSYQLTPGCTARQALATVVAGFTAATAGLDLPAAAARLGLGPYQLLTLASIVQAEGRYPADLVRIARVFYNRLARHWRLDADATLVYALGGHGPPTAADLLLNSPYNTRLRPGLPPTPIDSPGPSALSATLHPAPGPWLYFVTIDQAGHTAFAVTLAQQLRNEAIASRNGAL